MHEAAESFASSMSIVKCKILFEHPGVEGCPDFACVRVRVCVCTRCEYVIHLCYYITI